MRTTNIDTVSAYLDRLIVENIKLYFFRKDGRAAEALHQVAIIESIKSKLSEVFVETIACGEYRYLAEKRTFKSVRDLSDQVCNLVYSNIEVGESDRARLEECAQLAPNASILQVQETRLRDNNESRSATKNEIDSLIAMMFGEEASAEENVPMEGTCRK